MKYRNIFIVLLVILSCRNPFGDKNKIERNRYREKSPIEIVHIKSINGKVEIIGWNEKIIEVETIKTVEKGFPGDIKLLDVFFKKNERELFITTKIPTRINGNIDLIIHLPFTLLKVFLNSNNGNIHIDNYLGDLELSEVNGETDIKFQGNILRINADNARLNLDINTHNSSDIVITNNKGLTNVKINTLGEDSFLDIKSNDGNIETYISENISYLFNAINKNEIKIDFEYQSQNHINGTYNFISGTKNKNKENITISLTNHNGLIVLKELKKVLF